MEPPALYICPYCKLGFSSKVHGWDDALSHIKEKHRKRGTTAKIRTEQVPKDNLFDGLDLLHTA